MILTQSAAIAISGHRHVFLPLHDIEYKLLFGCDLVTLHGLFLCRTFTLALNPPPSSTAAVTSAQLCGLRPLDPEQQGRVSPITFGEAVTNQTSYQVGQLTTEMNIRPGESIILGRPAVCGFECSPTRLISVQSQVNHNPACFTPPSSAVLNISLVQPANSHLTTTQLAHVSQVSTKTGPMTGSGRAPCSTQTHCAVVQSGRVWRRVTKN